MSNATITINPATQPKPTYQFGSRMWASQQSWTYKFGTYGIHDTTCVEYYANGKLVVLIALDAPMTGLEEHHSLIIGKPLVADLRKHAKSLDITNYLGDNVALEIKEVK